MTRYRIYALSANDHVINPPEVVEFSDDQAAIDRAKQLVDGQTIEVWDGPRRVVRLPPKDEKSGEVGRR